MKTLTITAKHVADLRRLLARQHLALSERTNKETHAGETSELVLTLPSDADAATASQDVDDLVTRAQHDSIELLAVENALERIALGTYATCCDCGATIDYPRLLVHPTAMRCLACQELNESTAQRRAG